MPNVRPVSSLTQVDRDNPTPTENKAVVTDESPEIGIQSEAKSEADPPKAVLPQPTEKEESTTITIPPTGAVAKPTAPSSAAPTAPKMGNTRVVDGQKQVYFLGFGWIEDNDEPNEYIYAEDMYENGNKIGSMGGGTFVDGERDINKMVGVMD